MAADVLTRVQAEIDARLHELRPAVAEYQLLLEAGDAIEAEARERSATGAGSAAKLTPAAKLKPATKLKPAAKPKPAAQPKPAAKPKPKSEAKRQVPPPKAKAAALGAAEQAILAALEHGSHTVAELGVVTAMSGAEIRDGARRLLQAGRIMRAKREGRAAYALADAA